jgi:serine phosphatase RsbU (regulator of sigma subunit)/TPR repeat protein
VKKSISHILLFLFLFQSVAAQHNETDSLLTLLKTSKEDTSKVELLFQLCISYQYVNPAKALEYGNESKLLALRLKDSSGLASALNNLGIVYDHLGNYEAEIKNYFEALKIKEALHSVSGIQTTVNNIGLVYDIQGNYSKALEYYTRALEMARKLDDQQGIAYALINIGVVHVEKDENDVGLDYLNQALEINKKLNNQQGIADALNDIGIVYNNTKQYDKALSTYTEVMKTRREFNDSAGIASAFINMGEIYFNTKDYKKSIASYEQSIRSAKAIDAKPKLKAVYKDLAELYDTLRDYKNAYNYHLLFSNIKDSMLNSETSKTIADLQYNYDTEKKEKELAIIEKEKDLQRKTEENKQKLIVTYLISGVIIILLILLLMYGRFRLVKKQKATIEEKNKLVEAKSKLVETKNKEITDSIYYARRIQRALLANDSMLKTNLPEHFVLYKPKDIVSGDFYWATVQNNRFYLCVGDCTGHGVPGAFMSLLNMSFLNEAVIEKKIESPDKILDETRKLIISSLNADGTEEQSKDGMDAILCMFDFKGMWLRFACANNPLWLVRNNELKEFTADKMPVGIHHGEQKPFTMQTLGLRRGDAVYLITDGYADQFGMSAEAWKDVNSSAKDFAKAGGKKFKQHRLQSLLQENSGKPMEEQRKILEESFESWRGELEQVDDILIIGVRF